MEKKTTFNDLRNYWNSDKFIKDNFGDPKENRKYAKSLIKKLNKLPELDIFPIVAYGSLMNNADARRTVGETDSEVMTIPGWERVFNIGNIASGSFLNVRKSRYGNDMDVIIRYVKAEKMPKLLMRESLYDMEIVEAIDANGHKHNVYMVVADPYYEDPWINVQLNYLHLCMTGIKVDGDRQMMDNFLTTTYCYSNELAKEVTIDEWLNSVSLKNYLLIHRYSSR